MTFHIILRTTVKKQSGMKRTTVKILQRNKLNSSGFVLI